MKKSILVISVLCFLSMTSFSQGDFEVDNQTDCDVEVVIEEWGGDCDDCIGNPAGPIGGTAFANTQTRITNGGGQGGEWGSIEITINGSGGSATDGTCLPGGPTSSLTCNAEDIYVEWDGCSHATVKK